jgi:hypothetical protein
VQIIADIKTKIIYAANFCTGRKHDFRLFKESKINLPPHVQILADSGYQGIADIHANSMIPEKKIKMKPLTEKQKQSNRDLAKRRVVIEHIFGKLKIFRILSDRYRNRRKHFGLRFTLIAAIYNIEVKSSS